MDRQKRIGWIQRYKLSKDIGKCGICLDSLKNGKDLVYALKCHHVFHNNCINNLKIFYWKEKHFVVLFVVNKIHQILMKQLLCGHIKINVWIQIQHVN